MDRVLGIIPARFDSTRFPGKPLANIKGKPMIQWVYENASKSKLISAMIVATDDERIESAVREFGGEAVITSSNHQSGTDRIGEVTKEYDYDIVVNIQGDEPFIRDFVIDSVISVLLNNANAEISTAVRLIGKPGELEDPNLVKVVLKKDNECMYFSRNVIPFVRSSRKIDDDFLYENPFYGHIGVYAYRRDALLKFIEMPVSYLEKQESLEQLRALENGLSITAAIVDYISQGVDVPEDIKKLEVTLE